MKHLRPFLFLLGLVFWAGCAKEEGCTYLEACNYSEDAVVDDGSCDFNSCAGCTDPTALNYDPSATLDDGSCELDPAATTADCVSDVDFDNYSYPVVAIGGQCWFAENLRSTVFQDGTLIPEETAATFPNLGTPAQTTYNNATSTLNAQGRHYNGHAAVSTEHGGLCPSGWHVPSELDWMELESCLVATRSGHRMGQPVKATAGWAPTRKCADTNRVNAS
ncbi:MAG: FISUMP domain-containing protein, partial [Bacteroidota bacterium]|nr:FISUMP domain-containing protein [Bacteroidota bacterium]